MAETQALLIAVQVVAGVLFWSSLAFPIITAIIWPWWKSWWGRNIVSLDLAIALTFFASVMHIEFGLTSTFTAFEWMDVVGLGAAAIIIIWRGIMVFLVQWRARGGNPQNRTENP